MRWNVRGALAEFSGCTRLLSFQRGYFPENKRVIEASDGVLYGVTFSGGRIDQGTLYRINPDGSGYVVLHDFVNMSGDGGGPWGPLMESEGALYGTTTWGGALNVGTLFRYVPPPRLVSVERQAGGQVRVNARGLSGSVVEIEASTDLVSWTEIASGAVTNGRFSAQDPQAGQFPWRFYRARLR